MDPKGDLLRMLLIFSISLVFGKQLLMEKLGLCKDGKLAVQVQNLSYNIIKNQMTLAGILTFNIPEPVDTLSIDMQYKHCPLNNGKCSSSTSMEINGVCRFFSSKTMLGQKLSHFFEPHLSCPIQKVCNLFRDHLVNGLANEDHLSHFVLDPFCFVLGNVFNERLGILEVIL